MIIFSCPECGRQFSVSDDVAGRKGKCKACGAAIVVPAPDARKPARIVIDSIDSGGSAGTTSAHAPTPPPIRSGAASPVRSVGRQGPSPTGSDHGKLPVRIRRLKADAEQVSRAFADFPLINVRMADGDPPELYQIDYYIRGLTRGAGGTPVYRDQHRIEIQLTREYPRQSPKCKMLTPIFHPNIEPAAICVGDHWTAGERLVDLIVRIGEMITYQAYNIKSPLDGEAAMWVDQNSRHLPIDSRDLRPPDLD